MAIPTAVFLDTSILAGQQYNFSSTALSSFVPVAKNRSVKLLLPAPIKLEILRQIRERSDDALKALNEAKQRAPFLAKWKNFPKNNGTNFENWEVRRIAMNEWTAFIKQFTYIELGYEYVDLKRVMGWYDTVQAPFKDGKKRKEFPDAFAIDALAAYAAQNNCYIGIVTQDTDFRDACERFPSLLYFKSLPAITELLLSDDKRLLQIKQSIDSNLQDIKDELLSLKEEFTYRHSEDKYTDVDGDLEDIGIDDYSIVAVGDHECTITFDATLYFTADLTWEEAEYNGPDEEPSATDATATVSDYTSASGTVKLKFSGDYSNIEEIVFQEFDDYEIEVTEEP
jgi:hypothetical protein